MSVYICECVYVSVYMCVLVCVCVILIGDTYVADADGDQPSHIGLLSRCSFGVPS